MSVLNIAFYGSDEMASNIAKKEILGTSFSRIQRNQDEGEDSFAS